MTDEKMQAPAAPSTPGFTAAMQRKWESDWLKAFKQAQVDHPGDEITQRAVATREANRIFRLDEPGSYEEAMALEEFKVLRRENGADGRLKVVTIDGKKYSFPAPAAEPEDKKKDAPKK